MAVLVRVCGSLHRGGHDGRGSRPRRPASHRGRRRERRSRRGVGLADDGQDRWRDGCRTDLSRRARYRALPRILAARRTGIFARGHRLPAEYTTQRCRGLPGARRTHRILPAITVARLRFTRRPGRSSRCSGSAPATASSPAATEPGGSGLGQHSNPDLKIGRRISIGLGALIVLVILWGIRRRARKRKATATNGAPGSKESAS